MKSRVVKRFAVIAIVVALLSGQTLAVAAETVSGGDVIVDNIEAVVGDETAGEEIVVGDETAGEELVVDDETAGEESVVDDELDFEETVCGGDAPVEETVCGGDAPAEETVCGGDAPVAETVCGGDAPAEETVCDGDAIIEETVSGGDMVIIEDEEVALADLPEIEFEETVNDVTIRVTVAYDAFEEGTEMVVEEVEPVEAVIEKAEQDKNAKVLMCRSFDITFIKDGEEVKPANERTINVAFEGDMIIAEEGEEVTVYHMDDEGVITEAETTATKEEKVEVNEDADINREEELETVESDEQLQDEEETVESDEQLQDEDTSKSQD